MKGLSRLRPWTTPRRSAPAAPTPPLTLDRGVVVVLAPHPDDAVLSCWTVLESPADVTVVTVCTGLPEAGAVGLWDEITGARDSRDRMRQRLSEESAALAQAGRGARRLGLLDAQYRPPGEPLDSAALLSALARACPAIGHVYAPLAIGGHPDHVAARDVGFELARRGISVELYADLPYAVEFGWPDWVDSTPPPPHVDAAAYWRQCLDAAPWDNERLAPRVVELPIDTGARKLAALRSYETQFAALDTDPHSRLTNPLWRRFEVFWTVA